MDISTKNAIKIGVNLSGRYVIVICSLDLSVDLAKTWSILGI